MLAKLEVAVVVLAGSARSVHRLGFELLDLATRCPRTALRLHARRRANQRPVRQNHTPAKQRSGRPGPLVEGGATHDADVNGQSDWLRAHEPSLRAGPGGASE
jgi:hypothetical protein